MATAIVNSWSSCASENLRAAQVLLGAGHYRSCISRAYYSACASAHAILLTLGHTPPVQGNWSNPQLPAVLGAAVGRSGPHRRGADAILLKQDLGESWMLSLLADYRPQAVVDAGMAEDSLLRARRVAWRLEKLR